MLFYNSQIAKTNVNYAIKNNIQLSLDECYKNPSTEKKLLYTKWLKYFYSNFFYVVKFTILSYNKYMFTIVAKVLCNNSIEYYYITPTKNYFYSEAYR